tara:strand:+ start:475 stop:1098 length:624 start_codon:yes stop_codon:yes gene_type:complete
MTTTYDSPNSDDFVSPVRITVTPRLEYPFRQDLTAILYLIDYVQRSEFFVPSALDLTCPDNSSAYLVEESAPRQKGDGLCRFTRTFATVPAGRTEFSSSSFSFPAYRTLSADTTNLRESFTRTIVAKVVYSYLLTTDPGTDLTFAQQWQPLDASSNVCNFVASDTTPTKTTYEGYVTAETYLQSRETKIKRWKGNIWQMENRKVKAL